VTNLTSSEMLEIITRSVQETAKELSPSRRLRAERMARVRQIAGIALIFVSGMVAGALLVSTL
jgi:hypothetical protein